MNESEQRQDFLVKRVIGDFFPDDASLKYRLVSSFSLTRIDARNDDEWETLRRIRNECASFMTGSSAEITPEQQKAFRESARGNPDILVYLARANGYIVGFGLITKRIIRGESGEQYNGRWITLGITEPERGKGYGKKIYEALVGLRGMLFAEIREDNEASKNAAVQAGYRRVGRSADQHLVYVGLPDDE